MEPAETAGGMGPAAAEDRTVSDAMAELLRFPSGPLAPLIALLLNRRNRALIHRAIQALEVESGHRALDIGFGGAMSLAALLGRVAGGHVRGIDPSPDMVTRASRLLAGHVAAGRLSLEVAGAGAIPCGDASLDRVLTVQTVYFWDDVGQGLGEVARVLRPGGRVAIGVMPKAAQEHHGFQRRGYHVVGPGDLARLLAGAGFDGVGCAPGPAGGPAVVVARRP